MDVPTYVRLMGFDSCSFRYFNEKPIFVVCLNSNVLLDLLIAASTTPNGVRRVSMGRVGCGCARLANSKSLINDKQTMMIHITSDSLITYAKSTTKLLLTHRLSEQLEQNGVLENREKH